MTDNNKEKMFPVAFALREAGYIPLPRLWVKKEDIPTIHMIAEQYSEEVNNIRAQNQDRNKALAKRQRYEEKSVDKAKLDKESAWELHEKEMEDHRKITWPGMD